MKTMRNTILAAILMALIALPFVSSINNTSTAQAQEKTKSGKVNATSVPAGTYNLDPAHSIIGFAVRHLEINWVEGRFKDFTSTIILQRSARNKIYGRYHRQNRKR